jgi:hypothetical protein
MPRPINKLNARQVATASKPGRYSDGGGLYLAIDEKRRRWVFRYTRLGKTIDLGLGNAQDVSLAYARIAATKLREALTAGLDPKSERVKTKIPTFRAFAEEYIASMKAGWRNEKHAKQWEMTIAR